MKNSNKDKLKAFSLLLLLFIGQIAFSQTPQYVGINSGAMNYFAASQQNSQWSWAASIQMVLNGYGVNINQQQIVAKTYGSDQFGNLPNWPGSFQAIHHNLNNWNIDNFGYPYLVQAQFGMGAPSPNTLFNELSNGRPVIIGYQSGSNSGHAVVVTAISYFPTPYGPNIQTIVVRDPWPSQENVANLGRKEFPASILANSIQGYWFVRVNN